MVSRTSRLCAIMSAYDEILATSTSRSFDVFRKEFNALSRELLLRCESPARLIVYIFY